MFCPRCGQEQATADVRFCSRCGFALASVTGLLQTGGVLPVPQPSAALVSARRRGVRIGAKILFWSIALFPVVVGLSILFDSPGPLVLAFVPFLGGILRMTYAWLFEESAPTPPSLPTPYTPASLPGRTTGDLQPPPSVTEHTTRFLDN